MARHATQLPPGRHKIPREEVVASQQSRILAATVEAIAEIGYHHTIAADIVGRARVSRKTFYEHFPHGKDQSFLAAYRDEIVAAFAAPKSRRLSNFLAHFAERPAAARACLIETAATPELRAMRRETIGDLFPKSTADVATGALVELVESALRAGRDLRRLEPTVQKIARAR